MRTGAGAEGDRRAGRLATAAPWLVAAVWLAFWFWAFSFGYSDSFFEYDRHSRIPPFLAAVAGAMGILASGVVQWRARTSILAACLRHVLGVVLSLCPILAAATILHHAPSPWRPSGDDAMGIGIDFLVLVGVGLASLVVLGSALALRALWRRRTA